MKDYLADVVHRRKGDLDLVRYGRSRMCPGIFKPPNDKDSESLITSK